MIGNYTPLDINKIKGSDKLNTILMIIAIITLAILAIVLFLLIQKKIKEKELMNTSQENQISITPAIQPTATPIFVPTPTIELLPTQQEEISTETPQLNISPIQSTSESLLNQNE